MPRNRSSPSACLDVAPYTTFRNFKPHWIPLTTRRIRQTTSLFRHCCCVKSGEGAFEITNVRARVIILIIAPRFEQFPRTLLRPRRRTFVAETTRQTIITTCDKFDQSKAKRWSKIKKYACVVGTWTVFRCNRTWFYFINKTPILRPSYWFHRSGWYMLLFSDNIPE